MANKPETSAVERRNDEIADILVNYALASNDEKALRQVWYIASSIFRLPRNFGYLMRVERAKAKRKFNFGLELTERDLQLLPDNYVEGIRHGEYGHRCPGLEVCSKAVTDEVISLLMGGTDHEVTTEEVPTLPPATTDLDGPTATTDLDGPPLPDNVVKLKKRSKPVKKG